MYLYPCNKCFVSVKKGKCWRLKSPQQLVRCPSWLISPWPAYLMPWLVHFITFLAARHFVSNFISSWFAIFSFEAGDPLERIRRDEVCAWLDGQPWRMQGGKSWSWLNLQHTALPGNTHSALVGNTLLHFIAWKISSGNTLLPRKTLLPCIFIHPDLWISKSL